MNYKKLVAGMFAAGALLVAAGAGAQAPVQDRLHNGQPQPTLQRQRTLGRQREQLRQTLRDALSLCAVNASLTARAEAGVRRARSALGQAEVGLYGSSGESLRAAPHGGRRFGA